VARLPDIPKDSFVGWLTEGFNDTATRVWDAFTFTEAANETISSIPPDYTTLDDPALGEQLAGQWDDLSRQNEEAERQRQEEERRRQEEQARLQAAEELRQQQLLEQAEQAERLRVAPAESYNGVTRIPPPDEVASFANFADGLMANVFGPSTPPTNGYTDPYAAGLAPEAPAPLPAQEPYPSAVLGMGAEAYPLPEAPPEPATAVSAAPAYPSAVLDPNEVWTGGSGSAQVIDARPRMDGSYSDPYATGAGEGELQPSVTARGDEVAARVAPIVDAARPGLEKIGGAVSSYASALDTAQQARREAGPLEMTGTDPEAPAPLLPEEAAAQALGKKAVSTALNEPWNIITEIVNAAAPESIRRENLGVTLPIPTEDEPEGMRVGLTDVVLNLSPAKALQIPQFAQLGAMLIDAPVETAVGGALLGALVLGIKQNPSGTLAAIGAIAGGVEAGISERGLGEGLAETAGGALVGASLPRAARAIVAAARATPDGALRLLERYAPPETAMAAERQPWELTGEEIKATLYDQYRALTPNDTITGSMRVGPIEVRALEEVGGDTRMGIRNPIAATVDGGRGPVIQIRAGLDPDAFAYAMTHELEHVADIVNRTGRSIAAGELAAYEKTGSGVPEYVRRQAAEEGLELSPVTARPFVPLVPEPPPAARMYHGTAAAFDAPLAEKFDPNGLFGPGYYMTSDPRVAGSYSDVRGNAPNRRELADLEENLAAARQDYEVDTAWRLPEDIERGRQGIRELEARREELLAATGGGGPNIRAVDVPPGVRLLDATMGPRPPAGRHSSIATPPLVSRARSRPPVTWPDNSPTSWRRR